ncbi:hypothetical protein AK812_SmicGene39670 [Symbiodinium microadriaticum]|uniref:Uncharacterized protein n=1 Tax=Symbiodinium microadriaticum TaxID=2951 RepID=A0A1Q9CAY2_SYMMI|nr:hypothetical protein AK812_SmicGene39670 [Symbiodinium microadriaticum]
MPLAQPAQVVVLRCVLLPACPAVNMELWDEICGRLAELAELKIQAPWQAEPPRPGLDLWGEVCWRLAELAEVKLNAKVRESPSVLLEPALPSDLRDEQPRTILSHGVKAKCSHHAANRRKKTKMIVGLSNMQKQRLGL